jgi:hypothetical protein
MVIIRAMKAVIPTRKIIILPGNPTHHIIFQKLLFG